jgi:hypothetical protein
VDTDFRCAKRVGFAHKARNDVFPAGQAAVSSHPKRTLSFRPLMSRTSFSRSVDMGVTSSRRHRLAGWRLGVECDYASAVRQALEVGTLLDRKSGKLGISRRVRRGSSARSSLAPAARSFHSEANGEPCDRKSAFKAAQPPKPKPPLPRPPRPPPPPPGP